MTLIRRYSIKGFLSFDVHENEEPETVLESIERAYDDNKVPPGNVYWSADEGDGPVLEDEYEAEEVDDGA